MTEAGTQAHLTDGIIYFRAKSEILVPANTKNGGEQV